MMTFGGNMSRFIERAEELRGRTDRHYNCAQSTLIPFAMEKGLNEEAAYALSSNFGSGMKMAGTCGAVTGGLMVLGLYGANDPATVGEFYRRFKENHDGMLDCGDLLKVSREKGIRRGPHCDGLVYEAVTIVEEILKEKGLI